MKRIVLFTKRYPKRKHDVWVKVDVSDMTEEEIQECIVFHRQENGIKGKRLYELPPNLRLKRNPPINSESRNQLREE